MIIRTEVITKHYDFAFKLAIEEAMSKYFGSGFELKDIKYSISHGEYNIIYYSALMIFTKE